jgi:hypothetical protein
MTQKNEAILPHHNVQIPMEVLLHPEMDTYSLKVFAYMKFRYQFFTLKGLPFMESNSTISDMIGVSRSKVIESINNLVDLGFVVRQERHGKGSVKKDQTNIYIVKDILTPNGAVTQQKKKVVVKDKTPPIPITKTVEVDDKSLNWFDDFDEPF